MKEPKQEHEQKYDGFFISPLRKPLTESQIRRAWGRAGAADDDQEHRSAGVEIPLAK